MGCPEYYKLADGREFVNLADDELCCYLFHRVDRPVYHAIISAMEHRYRRGFKPGQTSHDRTAEQWWLDHARELYTKGGGKSADFSGLVFVVQLMVDHERGRRGEQTTEEV
jgi:hypothetical protein